MRFDRDRAELVLQFALLVMGERDSPIDRQLGPIHLLKYVYKTTPMLSASPNEQLDFSGASNSAAPITSERQQLRVDKLSAKKRKQFIQRLGKLRQTRRKCSTERHHLVDPVKNPRHDEIYEEGVTWLNCIVAPSLPVGESTVEFTEEVWKSSARKGNDVS